MKTVLSIVKSELSQRLFSWVSLIFFLMLVFQAIWYTKGAFDYYANENVLMNAPSIIYRNYAAMGMLMIIIIAISTGGVLYKDIQYKSSEWTYAMPINEKQFFIGRFLAAYLYLILISTGVIVGHFLLPYSGIGDAIRFGPAPIGQIFHGWLIFTVPNLLVYVGLVFFAIVFSRRMATSYLAVFLVVIMFLICQSYYDVGGGNNMLLYLLVDPGGYVAAQYYADFQTSLEKNTAFFELSGYILTNRLLWVVIALLLSFAAYRKFSFKYFIQAGVNRAKKLSEDHKGILSNASIQLPKSIKQFRIPNFLVKLWTLSRLEFLNIVRPTSFKIILGIILLMVFLQNVTWNATYYIGNEVPLSSNMTFFRLEWGVFVNMLIMIWAGELFFKDRTVNIWQITDTLPVPVWVTQLSRFGAVIGLSFVLSLSFIAISLFSQILLGGFSYIELNRFTEDLLLYRWAFLNFVLFATLVFFVAGLTSHRIITHIVSVGFFLFLIISFDMGIMEDLRYGFALTPGIEDFSEMSGYGIFHESANWFFLLWLSLAIALIMAGIWLWKRGADKKWTNRLSMRNVQLNWASKLAMLGCLVAFFFLMSFITKSVYDAGNFTPEAEDERLDSEYEKKYKYVDGRPHPKYAEVDFKIDLYPSERKANFSADILLLNKPGADTLFLNWKDFVTVKSLLLDGTELQLVGEDEDQNLTAYLIPAEASADSLLRLSLEGEKQYMGFVQNEFQADLTYVGSFGSVQDFLPVLGYDGEKELLENRKRGEQNLPRLTSRLASLDDPVAFSQDVLAPDAELVTGSIQISTDADQIPFAAGKLINRDKGNSRTFATYEINEPQVFNWHIGSSDYSLVEGKAGNISYSILHKPLHAFNLELYNDALEKGVAFMKSQFGVDAVKDQLQLVEIHRWQDDRYIFANSIVLSEKEGWVADTKGLQEQAYIYQTIGSGLATLWIQDNLRMANVQGAEMLSKALPEAIGLQLVKEVFGDEAVKLLKEKKMEKYAKDRNNEPNEEPSLLFADGVDYLEVNKGAVALYELSEALGLESFIASLNEWVAEKGSDYVHFKDLYDQLIVKVSNDDKSKIKERFEEVI